MSTFEGSSFLTSSPLMLGRLGKRRLGARAFAPSATPPTIAATAAPPATAGLASFEIALRAVSVAPEPLALAEALRWAVARADEAFAEVERERLAVLFLAPVDRAAAPAGLRLLDVDFCVGLGMGYALPAKGHPAIRSVGQATRVRARRA